MIRGGINIKIVIILIPIFPSVPCCMSNFRVSLKSYTERKEVKTRI